MMADDTRQKKNMISTIDTKIELQTILEILTTFKENLNKE